MLPYKAIQVRLLRMSAERLSEKDKVHATISKDNPGIRWSMTFYNWNKWIYIKSVVNKGWTPTCKWIREEQKNWTISFKDFFQRNDVNSLSLYGFRFSLGSVRSFFPLEVKVSLVNEINWLHPPCLFITVMFSQISLKSWGQGAVTWNYLLYFSGLSRALLRQPLHQKGCIYSFVSPSDCIYLGF